jgi:uncharacterized protein YjiK
MKPFFKTQAQLPGIFRLGGDALRAFRGGMAALLLMASCGQAAREQTEAERTLPIPYDLNAPDEKYGMPDELTEISGIAFYRPGQLACVQDENGMVYLYDLPQKKVVRRMRFAGSGDFEDLAVVKDQLYVVRSDGVLFSFPLQDSLRKDVSGSTIKRTTSLNAANDVEGLTYDSKNNLLLIACKEAQSIRGAAVEGKALYTFDLGRMQLDETPVYQISWPASQQSEASAKKKKGAGKNESWKPSGLAIHPTSRQIYLLASAGRRLLVLEPDGSLVGTTRLDPRVYRQPEGICFAPDGTLYISSEGQEGQGYILQFQQR